MNRRTFLAATTAAALAPWDAIAQATPKFRVVDTQAFLRTQGTKDVAWAIPDLGHLPEITRGPVARGYEDDDIRAILGGNYLRVLRECMKT